MSARVSVWGRLEARVMAALALLGALSVAAFAYLVSVTVEYFDARMETTLAQAQAFGDEVEPFHAALVEAEIESYRARAQLLAARIGCARQWESIQMQLEEGIERSPDLLEVRVAFADGGRASVVQPREQAALKILQTFDVRESIEDDIGVYCGDLDAVFAIDPAIDGRFQQLGARKRSLGVAQASRIEVDAAVQRVLTGASLMVLLLSLGLGFALARTTTRKVSELSRAIARVRGGDLHARSRARGTDELGQLSRAFNDMLDALGRAQARVGYLQRIGAWQEMARRLAHEIKNPLTPILLAVQQLRDKDPRVDASYSRLVKMSSEIVEDEIAALRRMVTSFSQFARVPEVRAEPVSLARILAEFEHAYGHLTEQDTDVMRVVAPRPDVQIHGDRQLLKQVLVNLVENAVCSAAEVDRMPVRVEVTTAVGRDDVHVHVDDNGPGIEPGRRESVFEPYETRRASGGGTGLGLSIVKKIVLDHGGEVWTEDSALGGARFSIRLRRAR